MGIHAQQDFLPRIHRSMPRATKSPRELSKRSNSRRLSHPVAIKLPEDVGALKQKILKSHPAKFMRFSLSHMRHVAVPPVLIPDLFNDHRAIRTLVSGKNVPLTMRMWKNSKRQVRHLDMIDEYVTYR
ncbi:uncharacterized protein PHALS_07440 [Plasmopara halstedii]|uniref:Uncharacterized protein n=1 Tax=Plasmopara halstedii TaxID=4781 RepID=A0A0P1B7I8_PLAHL|nr:uncharacterized protein PHALS_07440 [Plasmopara halstedii]CEG49688.1 hypothetical protein PHALS_07440 [Plasmopara halstedii]|eukprot:XP_024586057.1 hypothetical protein PHALS_07440 [Plasmopara halstedii]